MTLHYEALMILISIGWPVLLALSLLFESVATRSMFLLPTAAIPALITSLLSVTNYEFAIPWLMLGTSLGIDDTSRVFLIFSSSLWLAGSLLTHDNKSTAFSGWYLATMAGSFLVIMAKDIPTFYLSYALMSLAVFGLILQNSSNYAHKAAKLYLVFTIVGEMLLFAAFIMIANNAESLDMDNIVDRSPQDLLIALLIIGFGIKAGLPVLHISLPPVYHALPLAAAVPVAGSLLHLGLYGWMRFLPLGQFSLPAWSAVFFSLGLIAMFYGVLIGLTQNKPKSLLAYSSISQMGMMLILIGIGLLLPSQWPVIEIAIVLFAVHHALAKGALFYGINVHGLHRLGLLIPGLSLAGLPLTSGSLAKFSLKNHVADLPEFWSILILWLLPLASIGTTLLMARFLFLIRHQKTYAKPAGPVGWWILLTASLFLPWLWPTEITRAFSLWPSLWPVAVGIGIAYLAYKGVFKSFISGIPAIPPGDILAFIEQRLEKIRWTPHHQHNGPRPESDFVLKSTASPTMITLAEKFLGQWLISISLLLIILFGLFFLLLNI